MASSNLATEQLLELLLTLKKTTPAAAKNILNNQPAIAYALITLMVSMNAVNVEVFQNTLAEFGVGNSSDPAAASTPVPHPTSSSAINSNGQHMPPTAAPAPVSAIPPHIQAQYRTSTPPSFSNALPPHSALASSSSQAPTHTPTPPYGYNGANGQAGSSGGYGTYGQQGYGYQQQQQQQQPPYHQYQQQQQQQQQQHGAYPGYPPYGHQQQPPQAAPTPVGATPMLPDTLAGISDEQKNLIMRVLAMTPEQINMLPPADRMTYVQIRSTLGVPT